MQPRLPHGVELTGRSNKQGAFMILGQGFFSLRVLSKLE